MARLLVRGRYVIVLAWIAATVAATMLLPDVADTGSGTVGDLVATDADAIDAEIRSVEEFEFPLLSRTIVVQRDADGLSAAAFARFGRNVAALAAGRLPGLERIVFALPATNALGKPPFSLERSTTALTYLFFQPEVGPDQRLELAHEYADRYLSRSSDGYVGITGAAAARAEQRSVITGGLRWVELATVLLVLVAVAFHFRAAGAPFVNLFAVAVSYLVSVRVLGAAGDLLGIGIPPEVEPVIVALLFGVVTDYSIFFLSRFRGKLDDGLDDRAAIESTTAELLPIILVAGLTVAAATATLVLAELGFFQAFGPGLALSILVALAVALTLVPATLAITGGRIFWPHRRGDEESPGRFRARLAAARVAVLRQPTRHPAVTAVACLVPLLALAYGATLLEVGNRTITGLPGDSEARAAYRQASKGFASGILSPTVVVVEGKDVASNRRGLRRLQSLIDDRGAVATVVGPKEARVPVDYGAVYSPSGDAARLFVVLDRDPLGSAGIGVVQRLDDDLPGLMRKAGLEDAEASLAGDTALSAETIRKSQQDLARVMPASALVVFLILAIFLRALVAPVYLVLTSLLALAASLGLTVYVFQFLLDGADLAFYVPFAATVLLVALGSDYNVYLVGRIWAEAERQRSLKRAVEVAGIRASGAITVAGFVLAASFASMALIDLRPFRELAFAVAVGLLIDAFVVRSLLVPALITLVGKRSGWPGRRLTSRT
jgi:RND superfamily putative drug exporter